MPGDAIERVLDQIHTAILAADFATLGRLIPELEAALAALIQPDQALLERIARKATRNAICLQASVRGVRAAINRVKEVRQAIAGLVTYDGTGKRAAFGVVGQLARRF